MRLLDWAFSQDIPHAEKLVLVYLASQAGESGLGMMNRDELQAATRYKNRSIQRLLKSLRDSGHLEEYGPWYLCGTLDANVLTDEQLEELPAGDVRKYGAIGEAPALDPGAVTALASMTPLDPEHVAQIVGDYLLDQLNTFEQRIEQQLRRATFHMEHEPEPEPPRDPVKESPLYQQLIDLDVPEEQAYGIAAKDLQSDAEVEPVPPGDEVEVYSEPEDPSGRLLQVVNYLGTHEGVIPPGIEQQWQRLEEQENKHTTKGEPDAFLLLYPAIVAAAKAQAGRMTIADFLDAQAITEGRAPWDMEIDAADKNDPALLGEINQMLVEIEQAGDPRCTVQPRTTEKGDDGVERQETLLAYHRRVSAKHAEMRNLQAKGII